MPVDALIFDDDTYFAGLVSEILKDQGMTVKYFPDGEGALDHIRRERPGMVLLDVMMPGVDGISLCKQVKVDPQVSWMKVVVISGKPYAQDKALAASAQADLFVEKPFDVPEFSRQIRRLTARGTAGAAPALEPAAWTLRLQGEAPGADCVSFLDHNRIIALDAGSGLEALTAAPIGPRAREAWLFLSRLGGLRAGRLAHVERWVRAGLRVHVVGPADDQSSLEGFVRRDLPFHEVSVHPVSEGEFTLLHGLRIRTLLTMHPGLCLAYRLESEGRRLVFVPNNELSLQWETEFMDYGEKLTAFSKAADILIHDARYSDGDYPHFAGQGHSCPGAALRLALRARARRLLLYGADPKYGARERQDMLSGAHAAAGAEMAPPACLLGCDGLEVAI